MNAPHEQQYLEQVHQDCRRFPEQFQTLHLATCSAQGMPEASYAPYVKDEGKYYIYVSELAAHTANLATFGRCSVLFIESEAAAQHIFGRRRLSMQCLAQECPRQSAHFDTIMALFAERFGKFVEIIRKLDDFHLYALTPVSGSYVAGFAKAYTLRGEDLAEISHRREQGHRADPATAQDLAALEQAS